MQIGFYRASLLPLIYVFAIVSLLNAEVFARVENILVLSIRGGHSTLSDSGTTVNKMVRQKSETQCFDIIFSDLDGTLIHYPTDMDAIVSNENATDIISLPPSSAGMSGVISSATLRLIRDIRQTGVKFVLVSGMRASTLLKRMPFLPRADAYCCESGGRIFYPILATRTAYTVQPVPFIGSLTSDLDHFSLVEDLEWRNRIEQEDAAGPDGFVGHELNPDSIYEDVPISLRKGRLWGFAQILVENDFVVDSKGYSTCFRLNRKQQTTSSDFDRLMNVVSSDLPAGLSTSTNLGCIDIYPSFSGKKNWCVFDERLLIVCYVLTCKRRLSIL